jgi:transketolase
MSVDSMRTRFASVIRQILDEDPHSAVVLADIGTGDFAADMRRHADRVINVGIREQLMIGVAAGLALEGFRPIAHSYAPFLVERAYEQIKLDLGHQDVGAVLVSVGASFDAATEGRTHQAPADVALLAALPGWDIHVPGHPTEAEALLRSSFNGSGRSYVRLSAAANAAPVAVQPGRFATVRSGSPDGVTVLAVGPMLDPVLAAVADIDATVLYAATVRPFDHASLRSHAHGGEVVLVEPYLEGTSAAAAAEALIDRPHRMLSLGVPPVEHRRYGTPDDHAAAHGLDAAGIRRAVGRFLTAATHSCDDRHVA